MRPRRSFVLAVACLGLVACNGDDDGPSTTTASRATTTSAPDAASTTAAVSSTTAATTAPCPPLAGATTAPTASPAATGSANLTAVATTTGDCTDVVTFTFDVTAADSPGYQVQYQPGPITQDGSGEPVTVAGSGFLVVRFEPAYGYDFENSRPTYDGPTRLPTPGGLYVREIVQTGDFEAVITWVIGVDQQRPYTVTASGTTERTVTIELR